MSRYSDKQLQDHEYGFWVDHWDGPWIEKVKERNNNFILPFFNNFLDIKTPILEVGSGGFPISQMVNIEVSTCDPIHDRLSEHPKFEFLKSIKSHSKSFLELTKVKFNSIICLNCLDHFNDNELFFKKASDLLNKGGKVYIFYHLRDIDKDDHLSINQSEVEMEINKHFTIDKVSKDPDPNVGSWASGAVRYILIKK